jgi:hypothetical protein
MGVLPAADADRYCELAVFAGDGPIPAGAITLLWRETASLDPLDAEELLGDLVRRSLIRHDQATDTYTLHDLLFDYTRAILTRPLTELHRLLADAFLRRWGGLPRLPLLDFPYDETDRYGLARLIRHLLAANDPTGADAVLAAERTAAGRASSVWWTAHEDLGRPGDYTASVRAAWADARARHGDDGPASFARQVSYALLLGSIADRAGDIPPALLSRLVETRAWTVAHALTYAQAMPAFGARAIDLGRLLEYLPVGQRPSIVAQAFEAAGATDHPDERSQAVVLLAPYLTAEQRTAALSEALQFALDWPPAPDLVALTTLAPQLEYDRLPQVALPGGATGQLGAVPAGQPPGPGADRGHQTHQPVRAGRSDHRTRAAPSRPSCRCASHESCPTTSARPSGTRAR